MLHGNAYYIVIFICYSQSIISLNQSKILLSAMYYNCIIMLNIYWTYRFITILYIHLLVIWHIILIYIRIFIQLVTMFSCKLHLFYELPNKKILDILIYQWLIELCIIYRRIYNVYLFYYRNLYLVCRISIM